MTHEQMPKWVIVVVVSLALAACAPAATPTAVPTATPPPTAMATPAPSPTATLTRTSTPQPTTTATTTRTATATATPAVPDKATLVESVTGVDKGTTLYVVKDEATQKPAVEENFVFARWRGKDGNWYEGYVPVPADFDSAKTTNFTLKDGGSVATTTDYLKSLPAMPRYNADGTPRTQEQDVDWARKNAGIYPSTNRPYFILPDANFYGQIDIGVIQRTFINDKNQLVVEMDIKGDIKQFPLNISNSSSIGFGYYSSNDTFNWLNNKNIVAVNAAAIIVAKYFQSNGAWLYFKDYTNADSVVLHDVSVGTAPSYQIITPRRW